MDTFLATLFLIICVLLIIVVLLQKGRGSGLSGALGGMGSSAFGTRTGDVFTWVTIVLVVVFLLLAVVTTKRFRPEPSQVVTPTFIPPAGPIVRLTRVTVHCNTAKAEIFYTLDGAEPTRESLPYDANVPVKPDGTLKAKAFLRGWVPSETVSGHYPHPSSVEKPATSPAATTQPATEPARLPATAPAP